MLLAKAIGLTLAENKERTRFWLPALFLFVTARAATTLNGEFKVTATSQP
jgi:hypothetical protein